MGDYQFFLEESRKAAAIGRKPSWLKVKKIHGETLFSIKRELRSGGLYTVCEEAKCPNIAECLNSGTATFMILGDTCTRGCRFCNVKTGNPQGALDSEEPQKIADMVLSRKLDYVVITMVDRDDLLDGGAEHIAATISAIQKSDPKVFIEALTGDFLGNENSINTVLFAGNGLDVFAHNIETVSRTTLKVRDVRAKYDMSLQVLANAKRRRPGTYTKSGIMLGLGELPEEIEQSLMDLRKVSVDIVTLGQYLQPTPKHLTVDRFAIPEEFEFWEKKALEMGFVGVASGPLVRSSYRAAHLFPKKS